MATDQKKENKPQITKKKQQHRVIAGMIYQTLNCSFTSCTNQVFPLAFFFFFFFVFLGPHPQHMEVPRLGVKSELKLMAYTAATAMPDPSYICDLHHSSGQHQIPNPLSEARDGTLILIDTNQVC